MENGRMGSENIVNEVMQNQDKDGMLHRALEKIIQLYTDRAHFVYELLQNAEDAGASMVKFVQYPDRLEMLHDGHPFSTENLQGLCDIGKSDKINKLNQIGEFGVGFKSVFGICEKVGLFSHPTRDDFQKGYVQFAVEIYGFTNLKVIDDQIIDGGYTTKFIFPYCVGRTFSGFETVDKLNEVLSGRLQNLGITTLLFMKNLKLIEYQIELPMLKKSGSYLLDKHAMNDHCSLVSAIGESDHEGDKEEAASYLIFSRKVEGIQTGKTIDIAFALNVGEDGSYDFKPSKHPYISVYFPTETESKLKFIVQGPYRTTPNRSSVPTDNEDNIALAEQTSQLLKDSIIELRDERKLDYSLLNILPIDQTVFYTYSLYTDSLFQGMFQDIVDMMHAERILLCKDQKTYASADCVKIVRKAELAELFTDELLTELINDEIDYYWLPTYLTETSEQYKTLYSFLTGQQVGIKVIRPENLSDYFNGNKNFLPNRDDEWLIKFYQLCKSVPAAFSRPRGALLTAEIIKTSTGEFVAPYRKSDGSTSYLPNVFLSSEGIDDMDDFAFVNVKIYQQCKDFFKETLNLHQKPGEYELFVKDFKKRSEKGQSVADEHRHIADVKKLLKYKTDFEYQDEVDSLIRKYLLLKCMKKDAISYVNPYKETVYFAVNSEGMSIEQYCKNIVVHAYVDVEFYESNGISTELLKEFEVKESIAIYENTISGEYSTGKPGRQPEWHTDGNFRWKLTLQYFMYVLKYISEHPETVDSMAKSSFIFRFLQNNESKLQGTVYVGGNTPNLVNENANIVAILCGKMYYTAYPEWDGKWLYTKSGELVSQKEISKHDLNPQLYGEIKPDSNLYEILGFKKNETDYLEEATKDYDRLSEEQKKQYFEIELQRRYGISITDLDNKFGENPVGGLSSSSSITHEDTYEFPSSKVKDWEYLRKHAAEVLYFANPVNYEYCVRKLRTSRSRDGIRAYLRNMYQVDGAHQYACQMCHDVFSSPGAEMCQIANSPKVELDPMNLWFCPNCAAKYREMRNDEVDTDNFLREIKNLADEEIDDSDPVKVPFADKTIWFTQTHIAEIRELMVLQEAADNYKDSPEKSLQGI